MLLEDDQRDSIKSSYWQFMADEWKRLDREKLPLRDTIESLQHVQEEVLLKLAGGLSKKNKGDTDEQTATIPFRGFSPR
jgi:hypothetical protein